MKPSKIGKKIKYYREENKMTQQELADKIGVTYEMVSRYERGVNEPYKKLNIIAKALNVDVSELLQEVNNASISFQIPLFTKIPKSFDSENTNFFYTCPTWIQEKDRKTFALDMELVEKEENGVYYISPRTKPERNSLVLLKKGNGLKIEGFENQKDVLGIVLGKEIRLF